MNRLRFLRSVISLLAIFALMMPLGAVGAQTTDVEWEVVDENTLSAEVLLWVEANAETRGVYVLPAGPVRYLLVAWGEKLTGGYTVEVTSVWLDYFENLALRVELTAPAPGDMVTQALTYPYALIAMEAGTETITVQFIGDSYFGDALGEPSDQDPIIVFEDLPAGPAANPLVVQGRAQVFEATFTIVVEDGHFHLAEDVITVGTAGPEWAEFAVVLTLRGYDSPSGMAYGTVQNMETGAWEEIAHLPLTFASVSEPFPDVRGHWAESSIRLGVQARFLDGYPDGSFRPEHTVTRAEFLKMLVAAQLEGELPTGVTLPFTDLSGHWVERYVMWAMEANWVTDMELGTAFGPDQVISRQEMALLATLALGLEPLNRPLAFSDAGTVGSAFSGWVARAVEEELLFGYPDGSFRPTAGLRRSEAVAVVWRVERHRLGKADAPDSLTFSFTFDADEEGWFGAFTDFPVDYETDVYDLNVGRVLLPEEVDDTGYAMRISAVNASDDIFMYLRRLLSAQDGIAPNTNYALTFEVEFATDAPAGAVGVGGPPGEAVWVKVGASDVEPIPVEVLEAHVMMYVLNVDKGRQNEDGTHAIRIGDVAKLDNEEFGVYEMKTLDNSGEPLTMRSDSEGNLWIFVGTDSGFEGRTTLYYSRITVTLQKVS